MFKKVDCVRLHVPDIDAALVFYRDRLGMELVWKVDGVEAGLRTSDSDSEIVLVKEDIGQPEIDFMVEEVGESIEKFAGGGGRVIVEPFPIRIGMCSVVEDPWNNRYVLLDQSKGRLAVDRDRNVI